MPFFPEKSPRDSKKEVNFKADIYGIKDTMSTIPFTNEEIEKMRETVLKADRAKISNNVFDLSKPPVVQYRHQEFPKMVYDHAKSEPSRDIMRKSGNGNEELIHIPAKHAHKIVNNADELAEALSKGFQEKPATLGHIPVGAEDVEEEEIEAEPEAESTPQRKKPGRKPKVQEPAATE
jgi:hypothetical protein